MRESFHLAGAMLQVQHAGYSPDSDTKDRSQQPIS